MKILFVCTGNTCRSPMAEGIAKLKTNGAQNDIEISSAGLFVNDIDGVADNAVTAIAEIGGDISGHIPTQLTPDTLIDADIIVPMTASHKNALLQIGADDKKIRMLPGDVPDPYMQPLGAYRTCRDTLIKYIDILLGSIDENDKVK